MWRVQVPSCNQISISEQIISEHGVVLGFSIDHQGVDENLIKFFNETFDFMILIHRLVSLWTIFEHFEVSLIELLRNSLVVRHILVNLHNDTTSGLRAITS